MGGVGKGVILAAHRMGPRYRAMGYTRSSKEGSTL
jgi:hypothetical protein